MQVWHDVNEIGDWQWIESIVLLVAVDFPLSSSNSWRSSWSCCCRLNLKLSSSLAISTFLKYQLIIEHPPAQEAHSHQHCDGGEEEASCYEWLRTHLLSRLVYFLLYKST
jgi:hypothetical protein